MKRKRGGNSNNNKKFAHLIEKKLHKQEQRYLRKNWLDYKYSTFYTYIVNGTPEQHARARMCVRDSHYALTDEFWWEWSSQSIVLVEPLGNGQARFQTEFDLNQIASYFWDDSWKHAPKLTRDVMHLIFREIRLETLITWKRVNKRWKHLVETFPKWKQMLAEMCAKYQFSIPKQLHGFTPDAQLTRLIFYAPPRDNDWFKIPTNLFKMLMDPDNEAYVTHYIAPNTDYYVNNSKHFNYRVIYPKTKDDPLIALHYLKKIKSPYDLKCSIVFALIDRHFIDAKQKVHNNLKSFEIKI